MDLRLNGITNQAPPLAPPAFNPDPGASQRETRMVPPLFWSRSFSLSPVFESDPVPPGLELPRTNVVRRILQPSFAEGGPGEYEVPAPAGDLALPRKNTRANVKIDTKWEYPEYPLSTRGMGFPPNSEPEPDRWRIGFAPWQRYTSGSTETPYESPKTMLWHPYKQSLLKGDAPIIGQDIFLNLTAENETVFEGRRVPTSSNVSSSRPESSEFFGQSEQITVVNNFSFAIDLFKGDTVFQPVHWAVHVRPVYNVNYLQSQETGVVAPDPRGLHAGPNTPPPNNSGVFNPGDISGLLNGQVYDPALGNLYGKRSTTRTQDYMSLQEAFGELHLGDLSDTYDFWAMRVGNQVYNQDFRGFLFNDINSAIRVFGNFDNNRYQYNFAAFDMREKDTDSGLNTFNERDQRVLAANVYKQDFLAHGYTAQLSLLANLDDGSTHYDYNGNLARPEPFGTVKPHSVHAFYLGWAGDGHIGKLNVSHQFYQAFGEDGFNGLAGRPQTINAQMAALELSYDRDWVRYKGTIFYASGSGNAQGGQATGFDTVLDNPNFTGGPFSYWVRQGIALAGTSVFLKQPNSLVPDLRTSKTEGQPNFNNPGILILGPGLEMDLTPKMRMFVNANYIRFMETDPIKTALLTDRISHEVGWDLSVGFQYRPFLTDNLIISAGFGALIPGPGFKDIYQTATVPAPGYTPASNAGHVDDFLYSGLLAITFTY